MENIGPGENHGCPFRHHEAKTVRQRIESYGLKKEEVDAIHKKVEEGHYQIACGLHFSALHLKELSTGSVSHPNQWYLESRGDVTSAGPNRVNKSVKTVKVMIALHCIALHCIALQCLVMSGLILILTFLGGSLQSILHTVYSTYPVHSGIRVGGHG